jgi:hypothetical protein
MGRLVRNHSTFATGVERVLTKLVEVEGITTVAPGAINPKGGRGPVVVRVSRPITGGFKCTARGGGVAQSVFVLTTLEQDEFQAVLDRLCA